MKKATDGELGPWLALFYLRSFSLRQKHQLLERWGSPVVISSLTAAAMTKAGMPEASVSALIEWSSGRAELLPRIEAALQWQSEAGHSIVTFDSPFYPLLLKETPCPPLLLFVKGRPEILCAQQLAIVGSRHATFSGRDIAEQFARELAHSGLTITSGLALGIDTQAHQGAINANGQTVAVLGCGADLIYPRRNQKLADSITEHGAIISEFPLGTAPKPGNFPRRNRIVSGLSMGVVVIEAALKSGSLISAKYAAEQGREVFAVPGSIRNPLSRGCHWLIQQGAALVECSADILEVLEWQSIGSAPAVAVERDALPALTSNEQRILQATDYEVTSLDQLIGRTGLQVDELNQSLMALELQNLLYSVPGGFARAHRR